MKAKVTARMLRDMRSDRALGMTYQAIADKHGLGYSTVVYHLDPQQAERWRQLWRQRSEVIAANPLLRDAYNARQRERYWKGKANVPTSD